MSSQEFKDYECILIDDHSTDKSKSLATDFIEQNPDIKIKLYETREGQWGPGAARNIGLDNSNGEYVIFLDADDELNNKQSLQNINDAIQKNDMVEALILGFERKWRDRKNKVLLTNTFKPTEKHTDKHYQIGKNNEGTIWSGCWKKSLFDNNNIRFPENTVWEDLIPKLRLFNAAEQEKIKICGYSTHTYNVRPGKSIGTTPTMDKLKALIALHRKCSTLVEEGKIDKQYEKDIKTRVRNSPLLVGWMIGMAAYTKLLGELPKTIDTFKNKFKSNDNER